jgi:REP element-mobilizing transposase RayT
VINSLKHCQSTKGLELYGWCLMSNHIHLIVGRSGEETIENIIRDFKKFTSVMICRGIQENPEESRKEWMLDIFKRAGEASSKHQKFKFWQNEYHPIELAYREIARQKLDYMHKNPVVAGLVEREEDYLLSSAADYMTGKKGFLEIKFID